MNNVQHENGGDDVKKLATSSENILKMCRQIVPEKGLLAVNMRTVAKRCDVALGSIYYHFPSKEELIIATIESVWEDIFRWCEQESKEGDFSVCIESCFERIKQGIQRYPHFFYHPLPQLVIERETEGTHDNAAVFFVD
ncbi:TetR/AcrR family transcriptional regulator [Aerococcus christensenii]|nr:TetR/AcrR family transcriptional regulator [Aerococcus christensenii]